MTMLTTSFMLAPAPTCGGGRGRGAGQVKGAPGAPGARPEAPTRRRPRARRPAPPLKPVQAAPKATAPQHPLPAPASAHLPQEKGLLAHHVQRPRRRVKQQPIAGRQEDQLPLLCRALGARDGRLQERRARGAHLARAGRLWLGRRLGRAFGCLPAPRAPPAASAHPPGAPPHLFSDRLGCGRVHGRHIHIALARAQAWRRGGRDGVERGRGERNGRGGGAPRGACRTANCKAPGCRPADPLLPPFHTPSAHRPPSSPQAPPSPFAMSSATASAASGSDSMAKVMAAFDATSRALPATWRHGAAGAHGGGGEGGGGGRGGGGRGAAARGGAGAS
jgi:hypothetical protein